MKGDFSKFSYQASKHYAGVLMQQGRVTLDADWNEQFDIEDHRWRTQTIDTIGRACAPIGNDGFELALTPDGTDLMIKPGRIYIDGILVELDEESSVAVIDVVKDVEWHLSNMSPDGRPFEAGQWVIVNSPEAGSVVTRIADVGDTLVVLGSDPGLNAHAASNAATVRRVVTYLTQPYFPSDFGATPPADEFLPEEWKGQTHLAYLTVWRRHVTAVEDPRIKEVALGGPDTATRVQTVWSLRLLRDAPDAAPLDVDGISCHSDLDLWTSVISPSAGRMSAQAKAAVDPDDDCKVLPDAGYRGLENRLYRVEIHEPGPLGTATFKWSRDNGSVLTPITQFDAADNTKIKVASLGRDEPLSFRADDRVEVLSDETELSLDHGRLAAIVGSPDQAERTMVLSADVSSFAGHTNTRLRRWDHPGNATATAAGPIPLEDGVEVSFSGGPFQVGDYWVVAARVATGDVEGFTDVAPRGITKQYARLGHVSWFGDGEGSVQDCRRIFSPLCGLQRGGESCATVTVGDGVTSVGDFSNLQDAIDSLPADGPAVVSVLPGSYPLSDTVMVRRSHTTIRGCGPQTLLRTVNDDPAIAFVECEHVRLDGLTIQAGSSRAAVLGVSVNAFVVVDCKVDNRHGGLRDDVRRGRKTTPGPAVHVSGSVVVTIVDNALHGSPGLSLQGTALDVRANALTDGGVWIRDGSRAVRIAGNTISGGAGPGVGLGSLGLDEKMGRATGVRHVEIVHNDITTMTGSGISSLVARRPVGLRDRFSAVTLRSTAGAERPELVEHLDDDTPAVSEALRVTRAPLRPPTELVVPRLERLPERLHTSVPLEGLAEIVVAASKPALPLGPLTDISIVGNSITGCAMSGAHSMVEPEAVGGVVLRNAMLVRIHDNKIISNGRNVRACGVFLVGCDSVEVSDNVVRDNGSKNARLDLDFNSVETGDHPNPLLIEEFVFEADHAKNISIVDLVLIRSMLLASPVTVRLPESVTQAEVVIYSDSSVRVDAVDESGNVVATTEGLPSTKKLRYRVKGDAFRFLRIVPSNEGYLASVCAGSACSAQQAGVAILEATTRKPGVAAVRVHDNIVASPRGPALAITGAGPMSVADNNLTSFGLAVPAAREAGALAPVLMSAFIPATVFIWNAGTADLFSSLSTRFVTGAKHSSYRVDSEGTAVATGRFGTAGAKRFPDGRTSFHGNQVAFNDVTGTGRAVSSVAVVSLDDVALNDNEIDVHGAEAVLLNTIALGPTLRAGGNRWMEPVMTISDDRLSVPTKASYFGLGLIFSAATANQAVHCILPLGLFGTVDQDNQEMIAIADPERCSTIKDAALIGSLAVGALMRTEASMGDAMLSESLTADVRVLDAASVTLSSYRPILTESMALHQEAMAVRFALAGARLEADLGPDHPDVIQLKEESASADELRTLLNVGTEIEARRPKQVEGQWLVHGTIRYAGGEAAPGLKVRLLDPSRKRSDPVGEVSTDEFGNWAITYPECPPIDGGESGKLTLAVHGARNKTLFTSEDSFRLGDAPVDFVELELSRVAAATPGGRSTVKPTSPGTSTTKKRKPEKED